MAEVLCPIIPSTSPIPAAQQGRPSTPDNFPRGSAAQHVSSSPKIVQMPRNNNYQNHNAGTTGYRGTSAAPTYAFKATPNLQTQNRTPNNLHQQQPQPLAKDNASAANRQRYPGPSSTSTTSSSTTSSNPSSTPSAPPQVSTWSSLFSKNDSFSSNFEVAPFTTEKAGKSENKPAAISEANSDAFPPLIQTSSGPEHASKQAPGRYRGRNKKQENHNNATEIQAPASQPPTGQFSQTPQPEGTTPQLTTEIPSSDFNTKELEKGSEPSAPPTTETQASAGSEQNSGKQGLTSFKRYRRRSSVNTLDNAGKDQPIDPSKVAPASPVTERPSSPVRPPSSRQNQRPSSPSRPGNPSTRADGSTGPARTFAEVARRTNTPSPLSRPMTPDQHTKTINPSSPPAGPQAASGSAFQNSPAVAAMAALSDKDPQKGVKSKLRRAFSFGSGPELKKASGEVNDAKERAQARREQFSTELDEEQATIARQQEAAGLGESIYSGQAGFVGSTDNLSISSTASSASMMLRKMGKGVKKGGRSIKGLFRPKSAIGVAPPDGPLGAGVGEISRVTVEAEREKVNINPDPRDQNGGGTGFPKLERNSVETGRLSHSEGDRHTQLDGFHDSRKSIVGGDHERSEVLASVKRSILKRSSTASPTSSPTNPFMHHNNTSRERQASPVSNASNEARKNGHIITDSDYFGKFQNMANQSFRSLPGTPRSKNANISFSPRLQFYDVWSSTEYDRRGDIATCNRLTPMLAQQIKEELNTFKMEMEVHESSKPHTHFF